MLYGMTSGAGAMPMAPPTELADGTSFEQAAAAPPATLTHLTPLAETGEPRRVAEPGTAATLTLGLSLLGLVRRRLPRGRG